MPFHSPAFERLSDPALLGQPDGARQFELFGAALSPVPGALLLSAPDTTDMAKDHRYRAVLPAVSMYSLPSHVLGSAGLLARDSSVFWRSDVLPNYFRDALQLDTAMSSDWLHGMRRPGIETLRFDDPLAVATHPNAVYGHFLLEMLPRLYLLDLMRKMGRTFRLALSTRTPAWMEPFIALYFDSREIVRYDSARQLVRAPAFIMPSMLNVDYYLHPAMNLMADDFLARVRARTPPPENPPPGPLVYLSRRQYQNGVHSTLANGEQVEAVLAELGFATVYPETLSIREQMEVYANATCLVCEYGSAAHNALFARRSCTVLVINRFNDLQSKIATLRGQTFGIIEPIGGFRTRLNGAPEQNLSFDVDLNVLRSLVAEALAAPLVATAFKAPIVEMAPSALKSPASVSRLPFAEYLHQMQADGQLSHSHAYGIPERHVRAGFIYAEPIDSTVAVFGHLFSDPGYLEYATAGGICGAIPGGAVIGSDGLVAVDGRVVKDTTHGLDWWREQSLVAETDDNGAICLKRSVTMSEPQQGAFFVGFSGGWRNHSNWLIECLPRLHLFNWLRPQVAGLRLLLPELPPGSLQQRCVDLFEPDPAVIVKVSDDAAFVAQTLWCSSGIDVWGPPNVVREAAIKCSALVATDAPEQERRLPQRLYVRRGGGELVTNAEELAPVLARHGFVVVTLEDMTLDQQVRLLRQARLIVGESGPSLADILFCAPGARVLEIFRPTGVVPTHWSLASLSGFDYGYLVGRHIPTAKHPDPSDSSQCRVAPEQLEAALHWLVL